MSNQHLMESRGDVPIIIARDVHKWFGSFHALRGINMEVQKGEKIVIFGPSGSGKSTFIRTINRLEEHQRGQIIVDGLELTSDVKNIAVIRKEIGMVFQSFNLLPTLTIAQNIGLPLLLSGSSEDEARTAAKELAERVGLTRRLDHLPQQLSGGEVQRAAIVRAVIHEPTVLIADEPTGNLDSDNGQRILELLLQLNEQSKTAIIVATHDETVARQLDKVVSLRDGQVLNTSS